MSEAATSHDPNVIYNLSDHLRSVVAWSPEICQAAGRHLQELKAAQRQASHFQSGVNRLWQGSLVGGGVSVAYGAYTADRDKTWGATQWATTAVPPAGSTALYGLRQFLGGVVKSFENDIQRLNQDINWRCLPQGAIADLLELSAKGRAPVVDGVNFEGLPQPARYYWPKSASGFADPDYTIDGAIITAVVGGPLLKGAQWLVGEAVAVVRPLRVLATSF